MVSLHNSYLVKIYVTVTEKSVFSRIGIYVTMRQNRQRNEKILRPVKTLIPSLIDVADETKTGVEFFVSYFWRWSLNGTTAVRLDAYRSISTLCQMF